MKIIVSRWFVEMTKKLGYVFSGKELELQPIKISKDNELEFGPWLFQIKKC